jgi:hypothetical protein
MGSVIPDGQPVIRSYLSHAPFCFRVRLSHKPQARSLKPF